MFGQALGTAVSQVGLGHAGSVAGAIAVQTAAHSISTAAVAANMKAKDEVSLDLRLAKSNGEAVLSKIYKAKAKSTGDDIISQVVEQAATEISVKAR